MCLYTKAQCLHLMHPSEWPCTAKSAAKNRRLDEKVLRPSGWCERGSLFLVCPHSFYSCFYGFVKNNLL